MSKKIRTPLIYFAIVLVIIILITQLQQQDTEDKLIEYAEFIELVQQKQVEAVEFMDGQIVGIKVGSEKEENSQASIILGRFYMIIPMILTKVRKKT